MCSRSAALLAAALIAACGCEPSPARNGREGLSFISFRLSEKDAEALSADTCDVYRAIVSKEIDTGTDLSAKLFAACTRAGEVVEHDSEIIAWHFDLDPDRPKKERSRFAFVTYNIKLHRVRECGTDSYIK